MVWIIWSNMNMLGLSLFISIFSVLTTPIAAKFNKAAQWLTSLTALSAFCWLFALIFDWTFQPIDLKWIHIENMNISIAFSADILSKYFLAIILLISFAVQFISIDYLAEEKQQTKFWTFLALFIFSMHLIALGNNILTVFLGWELVGFCSWGLIGFWSEKPLAGPSAQKAFILNRIGDLGLILGLIFVLAMTGNSSFSSLFAIKNNEFQIWISLFLIMGALGKSAQFPLQVWLPDAMVGPTTASALIHAATMVAAGVYWLIRIFPFLHPIILDVLIISGAITALLAACSACVQMDIKKVLAYSTLSQLGLMTIAVGASAPDAAFFHLSTHAFFKAGLFLAAAAFIHAMHHKYHQTDDHFNQNLRNLAGIGRKSGITGWTFFIFLLALSGFPLSSGFLSKDLLLLYLENSSGLAYYAWFVVLLTSVITVAYSFRLFAYLFLVRTENEFHIPVIYHRVLFCLALASGFWFFSFLPWDVHPSWLTQVQQSIPGFKPIEIQTHHSIYLGILSILAGLIFFRYRHRMEFLLQMSKHHFYLEETFVESSERIKKPILNLISENHFYFDKLFNSTGAWIRSTGSKFLVQLDVLIIDGFIHGLVRMFVSAKKWNINLSLSDLAASLDSFGIDFFVSSFALFIQNISKKVRFIQKSKIQSNVVFALAALVILFCFLFVLKQLGLF